MWTPSMEYPAGGPLSSEISLYCYTVFIDWMPFASTFDAGRRAADAKVSGRINVISYLTSTELGPRVLLIPKSEGVGQQSSAATTVAGQASGRCH